MKWKLWKIGAFIAVLLSLAVAGTGVAVGITWQGFIAIFSAAFVTHFGAYIAKHPIETIEMDDARAQQPVDKQQVSSP